MSPEMCQREKKKVKDRDDSQNLLQASIFLPFHLKIYE